MIKASTVNIQDAYDGELWSKADEFMLLYNDQEVLEIKQVGFNNFNVVTVDDDFNFQPASARITIIYVN